MPLTTPHIPEIVSDWQLLYKPYKRGCYVNDHCLIKAHDGTWHLFGITRDGPEVKPDHERYFTHGRATKLISQAGFEELGIVCDTGLRAWAPAVVSDGTQYYMYYGPSPMRLATSDTLSYWMEQQVNLLDTPLSACHRDAMILRLDTGTWLMYATGIKDRRGVISVLESNDLVNWRFLRYALRTSGNAPLNPPWGATESPFVVARDGLYYLFVTYTDSRPENYHNTLVFCSTDPTSFGEYTGDNESDLVIAKLHAHAPEVIQDDDGQWYITTCGWRNRGIPIEGAVAIAKLEWKCSQTNTADV